MPVYWREALKGPWLVLVYADPYGMDEVERVMHEIFARPEREPELRLLIDRRHCTAPELDFVRRLLSCGERHRDWFHGARIAVVAASDVAFGMGRMVEHLAEVNDLPPTLRTFREWNEAERWLEAGAPPDGLSPR